MCVFLYILTFMTNSVTISDAQYDTGYIFIISINYS